MINVGGKNVNKEVATIKADVTQRAINVKSAPYNAVGDGVTDDTVAIRNAIAAIKTNESSEGVPTEVVKGEIILPSGKYLVSSQIDIPTNIKITGSGKNTTVILSNINDGSAVFHVNGENGVDNYQFFHNSFEEFTIYGQNKNCVGIRMDNCSRWSIKNVMITETNYEGLYLYESYIGDAFGLLVRSCGDATHASVVHDGSDADHGSHAVTYMGGEIVGAPLVVKTIKAGLLIKQGYSISLFGTTIQAFYGGYGIIEENGVSTTVSGCYFEYNKGHIFAQKAEGSCYRGNFMTLTVAGALGFIVVDQLSGGEVSGNLFKENTPTLKHLAQLSGSSTMVYTSVFGNTVTGFPIRIDTTLNNPSVGNYITSFDGAFSNKIYGRQGFNDNIEFFGALRGKQGLSQIGNATTAGTSAHSSIIGGAATPEGVFSLPIGSVYNRYDGEWDTSVYIKARASITGNTTLGWKPVQHVMSSATASRPTVTTVGFSIFDTTLGKPIWWNGSVWKDATGTTV